MDDRVLAFVCLQCKHTWTSRSAKPKSPQCSRCHSRNVKPVEPDVPINEETCPQTGRQSANESRTDAAASDLEGRLKSTQSALERLDSQLRYVVIGLGMRDVVDAPFVNLSLEQCAWCGAARGQGMKHFEYLGQDGLTVSVWRCATCGKGIR